jgi:autoinducer 2-degrading protein
MLSVWVRLQVREERLPEFEAGIAANAAASLENEPGCLYFDVVRLDEPGTWFAFYEVYASPEAFYQDHRQAPHYADWHRCAERTVVPGTQVVVVGERTRASRYPLDA